MSAIDNLTAANEAREEERRLEKVEGSGFHLPLEHEPLRSLSEVDQVAKWTVFQIGTPARDGYRYIVAPLGSEPVLLNEFEYVDTISGLDDVLGGEVEVQVNAL